MMSTLLSLSSIVLTSAALVVGTAALAALAFWGAIQAITAAFRWAGILRKAIWFLQELTRNAVEVNSGAPLCQPNCAFARVKLRAQIEYRGERIKALQEELRALKGDSGRLAVPSQGEPESP